jgi:hypothetical protein
MIRLRFLSNKFQKRTIRVEYNQFRAQPFAGVMDSSLGTSGATFTSPYSGAFTYQGGLIPGQPMTNDYTDTSVTSSSGDVDVFQLANGATTPQAVFGFLANFVGGNLDELATENTIGVWNGVGSTYKILAPAFNDGTVSTTNVANLASAAAAATPGNPVLLYATQDGRLGALTTPGSAIPCAQLLQIESPQIIRIRSLV